MSKKLFKKCVALAKDLVIFDHSHTQLHYSFLCLRNKIVTSGRNFKYKTDPISQRFGHRFNAVHSEVAVVKQFDWNYSELRHFTMVNVRLNRDLTVMMSKPCSFCTKFLESFNITKVFYSVDENLFERL